MYVLISSLIEELDDPAVSAIAETKQRPLGQSSMGDQNLLSQAPPCFERHVQQLVPTAFAVVSSYYSFNEG
jgi:hypothetical protein